MTDNKIQPMICGVCYQVLDRMGDQWFHMRELAGKSDHIAVPIDYDDERIQTRCDFCYDKISKADLSAVPASDFIVPILNTRSVGAWACCPSCVPLVEKRDWVGIADRAIKAVPAKSKESRDAAYQWMGTLHAQLAAHMTGPVRPWEPGDEKVDRRD